MKHFFVVVILLCGFIPVLGQGGTAIPQNIRAANTLDDLGSFMPGDLLYGIPMPPKQLLGDAYLNPDWRPANILLFTKETLLEGYPIRYDLLKNELEVKASNGIKVLEGRRVKSFVWKDSLSWTNEFFINASLYKDEDNTPMTGFFKVLADGRSPLMSKPKAYIKEADYNVQFDVGTRDDKIIKKEILYYAKDGVAYELPKSRKKILAIFGENSDKIAEYVKVNELDHSNRTDIIRVFTYYNSLE